MKGATGGCKVGNWVTLISQLEKERVKLVGGS